MLSSKPDDLPKILHIYLTLLVDIDLSGTLPFYSKAKLKLQIEAGIW